ncbi:hypothetical protein SNEBB_010018 [Seison nebaliae]|nr:hypothetical protein SNEBB_010018 [Seison nebaliae]
MKKLIIFLFLSFTFSSIYSTEIICDAVVIIDGYTVGKLGDEIWHDENSTKVFSFIKGVLKTSLELANKELIDLKYKNDNKNYRFKAALREVHYLHQSSTLCKEGGDWMLPLCDSSILLKSNDASRLYKKVYERFFLAKNDMPCVFTGFTYTTEGFEMQTNLLDGLSVCSPGYMNSKLTKPIRLFPLPYRFGSNTFTQAQVVSGFITQKMIQIYFQSLGVLVTDDKIHYNHNNVIINKEHKNFLKELSDYANNQDGDKCFSNRGMTYYAVSDVRYPISYYEKRIKTMYRASECSKKQVKFLLEHLVNSVIRLSNTYCLKTIETFPICGDGVQSGDEECDCGLECFHDCCNQETCKLRGSCDPSTNICCDLNTCKINGDYTCFPMSLCHDEIKCSQNNDCYMFFNETSEISEIQQYNGKECLINHICHNGDCMKQICRNVEDSCIVGEYIDDAVGELTRDDRIKLCTKGCLINNICQPTKPRQYLPTNHVCGNSREGICDINNICRLRNTLTPSSSSSSSSSNINRYTTNIRSTPLDRMRGEWPKLALATFLYILVISLCYMFHLYVPTDNQDFDLQPRRICTLRFLKIIPYKNPYY